MRHIKWELRVSFQLKIASINLLKVPPIPYFVQLQRWCILVENFVEMIILGTIASALNRGSLPCESARGSSEHKQ